VSSSEILRQRPLRALLAADLSDVWAELDMDPSHPPSARFPKGIG